MPDEPTPIIDTEGNFTETFHSGIAEIVGEEHKDTQFFKDIKTPGQLAKIAYDQRSTIARGRETFLEEIKETHIAKPAEDASDADKAEFRESMRKLRGAPENASEYEFPRPENLPEGTHIDEGLESGIREVAHKHGLTKEAVTDICNTYNEALIKTHNSIGDTIESEFTTEVERFNKENPGDKGLIAGRIAYKAMLEFATDKEAMKKVFEEAGIYSKPTDFEAWRKIGISPTDVAYHANIGKRLEAAPMVSDNLPDPSDTSETANVQRAYPRSQELFTKK